LTVSVLLKTLYAMVAYPAQESVMRNVLDHLTNRALFTQLTYLCQWAGWSHANLAVKYLFFTSFLIEH
jgi:hypothetical protein